MCEDGTFKQTVMDIYISLPIYLGIECDIIRKNLERHETNKNGRGDRAALT